MTPSVAKSRQIVGSVRLAGWTLEPAKPHGSTASSRDHCDGVRAATQPGAARQRTMTCQIGGPHTLGGGASRHRVDFGDCAGASDLLGSCRKPVGGSSLDRAEAIYPTGR